MRNVDFNKLVSYYERIASTRKRLEITDTLAELFIEVKKANVLADLPKIIYLTQGRLVSEIEEWPKFGIAEKMIVQAMVQYMGKEAGEIQDLVNKEGNVGDAVQTLLEMRSKRKVKYSLDSLTGQSQSHVLKIADLYQDLEKLSQTQGAKSQDSKIGIINSLMRRCNPQSAKYVINIILSNLRIGLADMTIMDSLAIAYTGSKDNRTQIERAYNLYPDLGKISGLLAQNGLAGLSQIQITVGVPIKMMLASRIQYTQIQKKLGGGKYIAEYKYDGERAQVHKNGDDIKIFSRQLKEITPMYPDVVDVVKAQVSAEKAIFEGEIVAMDAMFEKMLPFQVMSTRRRKYGIEEMAKQVPVRLFCFDVLYLEQNGQPDVVMDQDIESRRQKLESIITPADRIGLSQLKYIEKTEEMVDYFHQARNDGAEGIMNKSIGLDAIYSAGKRGFLWIKLKGLEGAKMTDSVDIAIIGASWGKGRKKGLLSTLFGAVFNDATEKFEFLTRVGSGFTDDDLSDLTNQIKKSLLTKPPKDVICSDAPDVWTEPKIVIEVMGDELTISNKADAGATPSNPNGYGLRFPVFQRVRTDKGVNQITTTEEILQLYAAQDT